MAIEGRKSIQVWERFVGKQIREAIAEVGASVRKSMYGLMSERWACGRTVS